MSGTFKIGDKTVVSHSDITDKTTLTADEANVGSSALVVDSSGNVGIGTSPSQKLEVSGISSLGVNENDYINVRGGNGTARVEAVGSNTDVNLSLATKGSGTFYFWSGGYGGTERMRIDTSGNLLVNASSFQGGSTVGIQLNATNNASNAYAMLIKNSDGNEIFQFKCNGSAASSSGGSFGTTSDKNLKENIVDATPKLLDVLNLQVRNFNNKSDPEKTKYIGFIAQELETIFPNLVEEGVDGIKSIKTSILIPILTKAIQEQQALIESQQSQIDSLTAKTQEQDLTIANLISRIEALETA